MSRRSILAAVVGFAALTALPVASEAHCLSYKHLRADAVGVVDGTTNFVKRVADRTTKLGDRLFGWMHCTHV